MKLTAIETGNIKLDGGAMFGVVPKSMWSKVYPSDENNRINLAMRCLLVETENRKILIDCGIGNKQDEKFMSNYFLNGNDRLETSLQKARVNASQITDVFLTHLHFDHCGGAIKWNDAKTDYELTFPNANYLVNKTQWEWATKPNRREKASFLKENILPMQASGHLKLIETEGELFPGVSVKFFDGHTGGQMLPYIRVDGKTIVYMADVIPTIAHIPVPYVMSYDTRPIESMQEREDFINEALQNNYILFFEHDLYHQCCTLQQTPKGVREKECLNLEDALML